MRRLALYTATLLLAASAVAGVAAPASATPADSLYALVNDARAADGLPALVRNASIEAVALNWANTMAASGKLEHNAAAASQLPSGWSASAENIATGQPNATVMHADWMASAGHRANILGDYTDVGIAFITVKGTTWGVQNFARYAKKPSPSAAQPSPSPTARQQAPSARPSAASRTPAPAPPKPQPSAKATPKPATPSSASATPSSSSGGADAGISTTSPEPSSTTRSTPAADIDHNPVPGMTLFGLALTAATAFIVRATRRARWGKHRGR
jgi:Cysteine-rich secretory protein family